MPTPSFSFELTNLCWQVRENGVPKTILSNLNLSIPSGQVVGIIGPNGAGKTSLLNILQGRIKPSSGDVKVLGQALGNMSLQERAQCIAYVSQHPPHVFDLTVLDVVKAGRLPHIQMFAFGQQDAQQDLVKKALHRFHLEDIKDRSFDALSGGEQQRAYLAQAMVQDACILLMDEPINHLDIKHQLELLSQLRDLPQDVILTLHDLNLAASYCDHLILMKNGQVVAQGTPREVLTTNLIQSTYGIDVTFHPACQNVDDLVGGKGDLSSESVPFMSYHQKAPKHD